jgi:hypothetical protein
MTDTTKTKPKTVTITITPELQKWIDMFRAKTIGESGFAPTLQQSMVAYMAMSMKKMEE